MNDGEKYFHELINPSNYNFATLVLPNDAKKIMVAASHAKSVRFFSDNDGDEFVVLKKADYDKAVNALYQNVLGSSPKNYEICNLALDALERGKVKLE